jgi:hypothetical protein
MVLAIVANVLSTPLGPVTNLGLRYVFAKMKISFKSLGGLIDFICNPLMNVVLNSAYHPLSSLLKNSIAISLGFIVGFFWSLYALSALL